MTAQVIAPAPSPGTDRPWGEGEISVSWIRLAVSGIMLALIGAYLLQGVESIRPALVLTAAAAVGWALFSAATIAVLRRWRLTRTWSFVSTATDIAFVTSIQIAQLDPLPLNFTNGPITEIYFVLIGLAAIRRSPSLVLFTGIGSAVVHVAVSTAFFAVSVGYHDIRDVLGNVPIEINYIDEPATAAMLIVVGWVLAQVTRRLLAAERHTQDLFDHVPDGILIVDGERRVVAVNQSLLRMTGAAEDDIVGRPLGDWLERDPGEPGSSIPPPGMLGNLTALHRAGGPVLSVRTAAAPVDYRGRRCLALSVRDVSEQRRLRRQLAESQKMETLGRLAGGLTRDLGRILDDTLAAARSLADDLDELGDEKVARSLARQVSVIHDCAVRAGEVAGRLRGFSQERPAKAAPVDLNELVRSLANVCRTSFPPGIDIAVETSPGPARVHGDGTELTQALLNLCINARDAVTAGGAAEGAVRLRVAAEEDGWVVEVTDDGAGMDEETAKRIFEPFFTTKPPGEGTGLGLSMVDGIVRQHGGSIDVESAPGAGSTFRVHLPSRPPPPA